MAYLVHNKSDTLVNNSVSTLVSAADYAAVELFKGYPDGLLKFGFACCVFFMMIGIPGNIITIVALAKYKTVHNATAVFIMNLSCADLLFSCMIPFEVSTYWARCWRYGAVLCRLFPIVTYILHTAANFTILAITINRYVLIAFPISYRKIYKKRNLVIMLFAIWIAPLISLIPTFLGKWGRFDLDPIHRCSIVLDQKNNSSKRFLIILSFGLPCIPILFCYARIFFIVRKGRKECQNSKPMKSLSSTIPESSIVHDSSSITITVSAEGGDNSERQGTDIRLVPIEVEDNLNSDHFTASVEENTNGNIVSTYKKTPKSLGPPKISRNFLKKSVIIFKSMLPTRKDRRLGTMLLAIMISYFVCSLPMVVTNVLFWKLPHPIVDILSDIAVYFSACINPVIYVVMSSEYRKAYKNLFKRRSLTQKN